MKPLMRSLSISSMLTLTALLWGCSDVISEQYPTEPKHGLKEYSSEAGCHRYCRPRPRR